MSEVAIAQIKQKANEFCDSNQWSELEKLLEQHASTLESEPDYYRLRARLQLHHSGVDDAQQWLARGMELFPTDMSLKREFVVLVELKRHTSFGAGEE